MRVELLVHLTDKLSRQTRMNAPQLAAGQAPLLIRNLITTIVDGDINPSKVRRQAILALGIVIHGRPGKATREARGTNQILVTPQGVMILEEAAVVLILAGIVVDAVPVHPVPVQDLQVGDIN